jgi:hypothetical protein
VEDVVESITRGNPGSVKAVLASVVLALATYQPMLAPTGRSSGTTARVAATSTSDPSRPSSVE